MQNPPLQLTQRGPRCDSELFVEQPARVAIRIQRVRLPTGPVERNHELPAKTLAQWMTGDEGFQLRNEQRMAPESEVGVDPLLDRREPLLVEAIELGTVGDRERDVRQGRTAPHGQGLA